MSDIPIYYIDSEALEEMEKAEKELEERLREAYWEEKENFLYIRDE